MSLKENHKLELKIEGDFIEEEDILTKISPITQESNWKKSYKNKGVVIAILDSGCQTNHPNLEGRIIGGYNFTGEDNGNITIYEDYNGHGTHIAGVMGGFNSTNSKGGPLRTNLLILKVLNKKGSGSLKSLIEAINYAIDWRGSNNEKVRIISLSLGVRNDNSELQAAIKRAINYNISVVASAGNDGDGDIKTTEYRYPGAYREVIVVGATDTRKNIAYFSNTNQYVDLYAPGVNVLSTYLKGQYKALTGTSMATAYVSSALAYIIEKYEHFLGRELNEDELFKLLMTHTRIVNTESESLISMLDLSQTVIIEERKGV